jgi:hypothetical protein
MGMQGHNTPLRCGYLNFGSDLALSQGALSAKVAKHRFGSMEWDVDWER